MKVPVALIVLGVVLFLVGAWMRTNPGGSPLEPAGAVVGFGALAQLIAVIVLLVGVIGAGVRIGRR